MPNFLFFLLDTPFFHNRIGEVSCGEGRVPSADESAEPGRGAARGTVFRSIATFPRKLVKFKQP